MSVQLVVAKYKEDVSWVHDTPCPVIIYDKHPNEPRQSWEHVTFVDLPNTGREAHTYLTHVVRNYDNLADVTFFLQGDPLNHYYWWPTIVDSNIYETTPLSNYRPEQIPAVCEHDTAFPWVRCPLPCWLGIRWSHDWWTHRWPVIFSKQPPPKGLVFSSGAQIAVPKHRIRQRPISYYRYLLWKMDTEPNVIDAWLLECFWLYIFGDSFRNGFPDRLLKLPLKLMD
jgi:hypothetical protein